MSEQLDRPAILVIDDEPFVRRLLEEYLARAGFDVHVAASGEEALAKYAILKGSVSLVLLDIELPSLDGPTTLVALRGMDSNVRCCFVSGYSTYTHEQFVAMGALGIIEKPFRLETLGEELKVMLKKSTVE
jgi:DNA-binding response OmpR family regulator